MKVLIADDDRTTRLVLSTVLREQFSLTPVETTDGIQTLRTIQEGAPDAVLLDLGMPSMTGLEVLKVLRAEPAHAALPVIVITGSRDQADVKEAIGLGVLDYLIKPLQLQTLRDRLDRSIGRLARLHAAKAAGDAHAPRVLLVDRDIDFREFFSRLFDGEVHVETRAVAAQALSVFVESRPSAVFLGEHLSTPDQRSLARRLRELDPSHRTRLYLCSTADRLSDEDTTIFDGLLRRCFVSEAVRREVIRIVSEASLVGPQALAAELSEELVKAAREAVSAATRQEIRVLDPATIGIAREVAARAQLVSDGLTGSPVELEFSGSVRDVERYAEVVRGTATTIHRGAADVFRELASTVAARLITALDVRGIPTRLHFATVITPVGDPRPWDVRVAFEAPGPCRVHVGIVLEEKERAPHVPRVSPRVV